MAQGDRAVIQFTEDFDKIKSANLRVPTATLPQCLHNLEDDIETIIMDAADNIRRFHEKQLPKDMAMTQPDGTECGWRWRPLKRIGVYVPGGRYPLVSTLLMNVIPAQVAGVEEIAVASPPDINTNILAACELLGIDEVYQMGGAQAIGALAYGTESVKPVQRITGPGNSWVTTAKEQVSTHVGIDMAAGPTEVVVLADHSADPKVIAADLISQAEHDPQALPILVTIDGNLADAVNEILPELLATIETGDVALAAIQRNGFIYLANDLDEAINAVNAIAPEHLSLQVANGKSLVPGLVASAIFVGSDTPVAWGDYWAGPNHTLPTGGSAVMRGPLSVYDYLTPYSVISVSQDVITRVGPSVRKLAQLEGLVGHDLSIKLREKSDE